MTILLLTKDRLTILTSDKKAKAFEKDCKAAFGTSANGGNLELSIIVKDKSDGYAANYAALIAAAKQGEDSKSTFKIGTFMKAKSEGAFVTGWEEAVKGANNVEMVDVAAGFAVASSIKDEKELLSAKNAARLSAKVMKMLKEDITSSIDEGKLFKHSILSEKYEQMLDNPINAFKLTGVNEEDFEACYPPTIQSGEGNYSLSLGAESDENVLKGDIIIASLGGRYVS